MIEFFLGAYGGEPGIRVCLVDRLGGPERPLSFQDPLTNTM